MTCSSSRLATLKVDRDRAKGWLERAKEQMRPQDRFISNQR